MDKWAVLDEAERRLLDAFASSGVVRVEYVVGFVEPHEVGVWLGTETDAQRQSLSERDGLAMAVADVLVASGIEATDAVFDGVVVQSQETVDRDYEGSWFYALR